MLALWEYPRLNIWGLGSGGQGVVVKKEQVVKSIPSAELALMEEKGGDNIFSISNASLLL